MTLREILVHILEIYIRMCCTKIHTTPDVPENLFSKFQYNQK